MLKVCKNWQKVVKIGKNSFSAHQQYEKWGYEHIWAQKIALEKSIKFFMFYDFSTINK